MIPPNGKALLTQAIGGCATVGALLSAQNFAANKNDIGPFMAAIHAIDGNVPVDDVVMRNYIGLLVQIAKTVPNADSTMAIEQSTGMYMRWCSLWGVFIPPAMRPTNGVPYKTRTHLQKYGTMPPHFLEMSGLVREPVSQQAAADDDSVAIGTVSITGLQRYTETDISQNCAKALAEVKKRLTILAVAGSVEIAPNEFGMNSKGNQGYLMVNGAQVSCESRTSYYAFSMSLFLCRLSIT